MRRFVRLIIAIILPTIIASLVFLAMARQQTYGPKDYAILFGLLMTYGTMLWAIPGTIIWLIIDSLWKANPSFQRPITFSFSCACLGFIGGLLLNVIAFLIWNAQSHFSYALFGIVGAFATAIASWPLRKLQIEDAQHAPPVHPRSGEH